MRGLKLALVFGFILGFHGLGWTQSGEGSSEPPVPPEEWPLNEPPQDGAAADADAAAKHEEIMGQFIHQKIEELQSSDPAVQQEAVNGLGQHLPRAIAALRAVLADRNNPLKKRANAAWAFGQIGIQIYEPIPELHEALRESQPAMVVSAQRAFEALGISPETETRMWEAICRERERQLQVVLARHNLLLFQETLNPDDISVDAFAALPESDRKAFREMIEFIATGDPTVLDVAHFKSLPAADREFFVSVLQREMEKSQGTLGQVNNALKKIAPLRGADRPK